MHKDLICHECFPIAGTVRFQTEYHTCKQHVSDLRPGKMAEDYGVILLHVQAADLAARMGPDLTAEERSMCENYTVEVCRCSRWSWAFQMHLLLSSLACHELVAGSLTLSTRSWPSMRWANRCT